MLFDINYSNILFDPPPRIMTIKTKINQWDLIKLKSFCPADTSFKISQEHCLFLLALFISIMFISFWQNIYFIFYYYQFPPLIYTLRKKDLFLFWSATCALEKKKKNHARLQSTEDAPRMEFTFPNLCCIKMMSFSEPVYLRKSYFFLKLFLSLYSCWMLKIRVNLGISISLDLWIITWIWPL